MRINQILTESEQQQLQDLYEGPKFNKFGKAVGDIAGMAAKGVGAVAGGIAGAGSAIKKGFQAGKDRVAQGGDSPDAVIDPQKRTRAKAAPAGGTTAPQPTGDPTGTNTADPAADPATTGKKPGFIAGLKAGLAGKPTPTGKGGAAAGAAAPAPADNAADANAQGPKGTAPAKTQTGAAAAAMKKTADATAGVGAEKAGQTLYAQVKSQVNQLDKKGKQRIMQLLQKSLQQPAPAAAPGAGAMGNMAGQLAKGGAAEPNTMANAPVSKTNKAKPGNPNAQSQNDANPYSTPGTPEFAAVQDKIIANSDDEKLAVLADQAKTPGMKEKAAAEIAKRANSKKPAAPSQAEIDTDRDAKMGPTSDSIIRTGNNLAETLMQAIAEEKRRMVAEGKISIFRKQ
jgi:hypothetical protein